MKNILFILCTLISFSAFSQSPHHHTHQREMVFPDVPGYKTLKCDFHIHTVFSDGNVWPSIRIQEATKDGLDAVSMTEHLEYQPHEDDIPHPDRNRSHEVATAAAKGTDLLVVSGSEITRDMPPGHSNAIFVEDANKLMIKDAKEVFVEAKKQGAFVFWNHPNWTSHYKDGIAKITDMHKELIKEGMLHGVEVVNDLTYSDEALQIALDYDLTIMGTSDIHGLVDWSYGIPEGGHRPITLVFAKEKSQESIKKALFEKRTVAWFHDKLVGRAEYLIPLIKASLIATEATYDGGSTVLAVTIENNTSVEYTLQNLSEYTFHANSDIVKVPHHGSIELLVKTIDKKNSIDLKFKVLNGVTAPKMHPDITIPVKVSD